MPDDSYGNIISTTHSNSSNIQWNRGVSTTDHIMVDTPFAARTARITLRDIDLTQYTERELRDFRELLGAYIDLKFPPKPPKFKSVEEADAWMEKHYGQ